MMVTSQKPTFRPAKADLSTRKSRLFDPQKPTFRPAKADLSTRKSRPFKQRHGIPPADKVFSPF